MTRHQPGEAERARCQEPGHLTDRGDQSGDQVLASGRHPVPAAAPTEPRQTVDFGSLGEAYGKDPEFFDFYR